MPRHDGDGFVRCTCGGVHWGLFGAAGLLVVRRDLDEPHALLQLRAAWTHGGGTWALPGGALDSHEDAVTAAVREAHEEAGITVEDVNVVAIVRDDHGIWRYDTVIAHTHGDAGAHCANAESDAIAWVPLPDVTRLPLHPGLAASWPTVHSTVLESLG